MRQLAVVCTLAIVLLASAQALAQVTVQMGFCNPQMSSPAFPPAGTLQRSMELRWGWVHPTPENQTAVDQDFAAIDKVEVCWKEGTSAAVCPFTSSQGADTAWLIYQAPSQPVTLNTVDLVDESVAPFIMAVPADWLDPPSQPTFLFIRIDDEPVADAVQRGFCLWPEELVIGDEFRVYGTLAGTSFPYLTGLSLDPCVDGNRARQVLDGMLDFTTGVKQACVHEDMPGYVQQRFLAFDTYQRLWIQDLTAPNLDTWQHGSVPTDCHDSFDECPTRIFLSDLATPGGHHPGRVWLRLTQALFQTSFQTPAPLAASRGALLTFGSHEYGHALQFAWNRNVVDVFDPANDNTIAAHPALVEALNDMVGWDHCLFDQPDLVGLAVEIPEELCISPSRIAFDGNRPGPGNKYLAKPGPGKNKLFKYGNATGGLFFRYAAEQFAVPQEPPNRAHPGGEDSSIESNFNFDVGHVDRRTDEGIDLLRHIWEHMDPAAHSSSWTWTKRLNAALVEQLGRGLNNVMLDMHSALVLKDYRPLDTTTDARWHLDLIGNLNRGADDDYFPSQPRPAVSHIDILEDPVSDGRYDFITLGLGIMPDEVQRPFRVLEDYIPNALGPNGLIPGDRIVLAKGSTVDGVVSIVPRGVAYLAVHPETLTTTGYPLRISAKVVSGFARMRIFRIQHDGTPKLLGSCSQFPEGPAPAPEEQCVSHESYVLGFTFDKFEETIGWSKASLNPYDEVIVQISTGGVGAGVSWEIDSTYEPSTGSGASKSNPRKASPPGSQGPGSPGTPKFMVPFRIEGEDGSLSYDPGEMLFTVVGCESAPCELSAADDGVTVERLDDGEYRAYFALPTSFFEENEETTFDLKVTLPDGTETVEEDAITVLAEPPSTAIQLVIDTSNTMNANSGVKLAATKIASKLLVAGLDGEDAIGVVQYTRDARTKWALASMCTTSTRSRALEHISALTATGCASPGDGLFEAQSGLAAKLDPGQPGLACAVDHQAVIIVADAATTADYAIDDYIASSAGSSPTTDGTGADASCGSDTDTTDNGSWFSGELRFQQRMAADLRVPQLSAMVIGDDADAAGLTSLVKSTRTEGALAYVADPSNGTAQTLAALTIALSDGLRQAADAASGFDRQTAFSVDRPWPVDLPALEVDGLTDEMLVSMGASAASLVGIKLVTPSGSNVSPAYESSDAVVFRVAAPAAGTWTWQRTGSTPSAAGYPRVFVEQAVRSKVQLFAHSDVRAPRPLLGASGSFDAQRYTHQDIALRVVPMADESLLGAAVEADVITPTGATATIALHDDGMNGDATADDGIYGARFSDTSDAGMYRFIVAVDGVADGETFHRERSLAVRLDKGPDADEDDLPDWWEGRHSGDATALDPNDDDDHDGLTNIEELEHRTSPLHSDSDDGEESDASEVARSADPRDPSDDEAGIFELVVAPGDDQVVLRVGGFTAYNVTIERGPTPSGPFEELWDDFTEGGIFYDEADNDTEVCYRMRSTIADRTSGWSAADCVTPKEDPYAPGLRLSLPSETHFASSHELVVNMQASDRLPRQSGCTYREPSPLTGCVDAELIDELVEESGVSEMIVYTALTRDSAEWQPIDDSFEITLDESRHVDTVYARVRDEAGNESSEATLTVWVVEE